MHLFELLAISVALSMDALAVSVTTGVTLKRPTAGQLFRMPAAFGLFQFLMPLAGWLLGNNVHHYIQAWDHWIACGLLVFVATKLLRDTLRGGDDEENKIDPTKGWTIVMLAVATSIDAMAVGFSYAMLSRPILVPALVIGVICATISFGGMLAGSCIGRIDALRKWSGVAGACALYLIGVLILREHGVF